MLIETGVRAGSQGAGEETGDREDCRSRQLGLARGGASHGEELNREGAI